MIKCPPAAERLAEDGDTRAQQETDRGLGAWSTSRSRTDSASKPPEIWGLHLSAAIRTGEAALFTEPGLFVLDSDGTPCPGRRP